jgi:hypothetical protein
MTSYQHTSDPEIEIECFTRASARVGPVDETISRLHDLEEQGVVDSLTFTQWPDEIVVSDATEEPAELAQYRRLKTWATQENVSLHPAFEVYERTSMLTDHPKVVLTLPVLCVAITVDDDLVTVAPHRPEAEEETETVGVRDVLAGVERRSERRASPPTPADGDATADGEPESCPACSAPLVNGQGLYACTACPWDETRSATPTPESTDGDAVDTEEAPERSRLSVEPTVD